MAMTSRFLDRRHAHGGSAGAGANGEGGHRPGRRWIVTAVVAAALLVGVYVFAVLTPWGQQWENSALTGSGRASPEEEAQALDSLAAIQVWSLAGALIALASIGLLRRQILTTIVALAVVLGGAVGTEVLKRWILPRPDLVSTPVDLLDNSFPSGHTAIAMTTMVAVFLVVPYRWRGWAMFVVMTWATSIGQYTVTAHWHRLSDTVGADLIALILGSIAAYLLHRRGLVRVVDQRRYGGRVVYVVVASILGLISLALGALLAWVSIDQEISGGSGDHNAFLATQVLAGAFSTAAALVYWATWHRLEIAGPSQSLR
ncbi:phosphatase PAP2 family protein [Agreia sp. Leaf244]|uniref:phosphatase PAP2 family protein n=1 Tax=Agreia sp. Leaf244 TaxID=1736305 RepID=UPI000A698C83|nr:phosphatase PAP2 family protein [Agreia sp. Leaf244]